MSSKSLDLMNSDYSENIFFSVSYYKHLYFRSVISFFYTTNVFWKNISSKGNNKLVSIKSQHVVFMLSTYSLI